jgi:hypothetical protein
MMLKLFESDGTRRVSAEELNDYRTFSEHYQISAAPKELQVFERFYAARTLSQLGMQVFLDPVISQSDISNGVRVDACGRLGEALVVILCDSESIGHSLTQILELISAANNARAIILAPTGFDVASIEDVIPHAFSDGKISLERLGWFDDHFDRTLQETLRLIDLLGNETRMRMLTPLFRRTSDKREYRTTINPKLVYKNLEVLLEAKLVDEKEAGYELSGLGKSILAEFITFLEKTRKTLGSARETGGEK